jgi:hypothetical protein
LTVLVPAGRARGTARRPAPGEPDSVEECHEGVEAVRVSVQEQQGTAARRAAGDLAVAVEGLARVFPLSVEGADDEGVGPRRR